MGQSFYDLLKDAAFAGGGGGSPAPVLIEKSATQNGTYTASDDDADGYSTVTVNVPNTYAAGDEGKVVSNGTLVAQTSATFTENGTYDTTGISSITIAVPVPVKAHTYGVVWDKTQSSPQLTRTDESSDFDDPDPYVADGNHPGSSPFDTLMPWAGMVKETIDGNVLVKIPKFWYKITNTSNELKIQIADEPMDGFKVSPAHADRGDGKGERDYVYIARYKCSSTDYKSVTGKSPKVSITRDAARTAIKSLGAGFYQQDFAMFWTTRMLYLVEYANWDSQAAIGYGCGNSSSVQNTGASDIMTYHTGTMQSTRTAYGVGVQYRWIEDPWGNVREWCDGIYFSSSNVYCINNPANFSDTTGGTKVGTRPTTAGYISDWSIPTATGFEYALYPSAVSGGDQTYIADYCGYNSSGVVLCVGGGYNQSQSFGMFLLSGGNYASDSYDYLGARLMYLP